MNTLIRFSLLLIFLSAIASSCEKEILVPSNPDRQGPILTDVIVNYQDSVEQARQQRLAEIRDSIRRDSLAQIQENLEGYVSSISDCSSGASNNGSSTNDYRDQTVGNPSTSVGRLDECTTQEREVDFSTDFLPYDITQAATNYPGMLLSDLSLAEGLVQPLPLHQLYLPIISTNIPQVGSVQLAGHNLSNYRDAHSELINQIPAGQRFSPVVEVNISEFVYSAAHLRFIFEGKASVPLVAKSRGFLDLALGYRGTTLVVVKGMNTFTLAADIPADLTTLFDAQNLPPGDVCPLMLKGTTYGKIHVMIFESDSIGIDFKEEFSASANILAARGSSSLTATQRGVLRTAKIRTLTIGGTEPYTLNEAIPYNDVDVPDFTVSSATWGANDYGVPLGYHYTYLDGTPFTTSKTTTYAVTECEPVRMYSDIRTCATGSRPGAPAERRVHLTGARDVVTGFSADIHDSNVDALRLQKRILYADGTLGSREYQVHAEDSDPYYEVVWEAPDGWVVVNLGGGESRDDFRTLKAVIAQPYVDGNGNLRLKNHRTVYDGREPNSEDVDVYCSSFSSHQLLIGLEMAVNDDNLNTWRVTAGILD